MNELGAATRNIRVEALTAADMMAALPALARLRIEVFRDFPYLYDGTLDYEQRYLDRFAKAPSAVIVAALDGATIIGVATAAPLVAEHPEFIEPFERHGLDPARIFYFAESVLRTDYRGRGIGHRFFDLRERHAMAQGDYLQTAFCAVVRPTDHPRWPADYRPLDTFWRRRGYKPVPGLTTRFRWRDVGESEESAKSMQFWTRDLPGN